LKWTFRHRFYPWTRRSFGAHHRPSGSKRAGGHEVPPTVSGFGSIAMAAMRVEVGDEGHGMSEEFVQTRLFKPFRPLRKLAWALAPTRVFSMCRSSGQALRGQPGRQGNGGGAVAAID
jgi:hypothetical protein